MPNPKVAGVSSGKGKRGSIMKEYRFDTHGPNQPSYYVFNRREDAPGRPESAFYHYNTPQEAIGLFNFLLAECPSEHFFLGVHRDYTRRADIIEHVGGDTILLDDFKRISPWKDDPAVAEAAKEAVKRLPVQWRVDRELADARILVPCESRTRTANPFFDDKSLLPDEPGSPSTSIREAFVEGEGWISFDQLKAQACHHWYDMGERPKVTSLLVAYQMNHSGNGATTSMTPVEFGIMKQRYEAEQEREGPRSLEEVKLQAHWRSAEKNAVRRDAGLHLHRCGPHR